ncbi:recombinase family protein [Streptomyces sp. NPDC002131]|uniref:recombinase family protein n=1 Tax=Streptomyces sp. NPDC002131 TaxID=3154535 RepID=UPI0033330CE0
MATTPRTSLRLALYLRVSTGGQLDGYGLDTQEADCRRWANKNGHRIVAVRTDGAVTGKSTDDERAGLTEALAILADGQADGLLAPNLDRLARELTVQEAALSVIWAYGSRAFTADHGEHLADDEDDPMRTFVRHVMGAAAQLERGLIVKKLKGGRRAKAAKGGYAHGAPAYGQRAADKELTVDDDEAAVLAQMRAWQTEGLSIRAIAAKLNEAEIPTKRGGMWHPTTVNRLLSPDARAAARRQSAQARAAERELTKRQRADKILSRLT